MYKTKTLIATLCAFAASVSGQSYTYTFDAAGGSGIVGNIKVKYGAAGSATATISANLDFSKVDLAALTKADGNCTQEAVEYSWHIHTKWSSQKGSESYGQCSKALTGNHYDPLKACGPNSEYADTDTCKAKIPNYACNPANYAKDCGFCEKGDLSGKMGKFKLDANKKVSGTWTDVDYPSPSENTPQWNMMLHAVCGKAAPRVACAVGVKAGSSSKNHRPKQH